MAAEYWPVIQTSGSRRLNASSNDDGARVEMIARAQHKLELSYGIDQHQRQILEIVEMARRVVAGDEKRSQVS